MSAEELPDDDLKRLESEVSDLLSEAEELSDQLANEVGSEQPPASADGSGGSKGDAVAARVDDQLAAADSALADTTRELGSEPAPPSQKPKKPKGISLPPKGSAPKEPAPAANAQAGKASASANQPQGRPKQPVPKKPITLPGKPQGAKGAKGAGALVAATVDQAPFETQGAESSTGRLRAIIPTERIGKACTNSANAAAGALEWMDRPFHFLGYRVRTILGWVAVAMMTAAVGLLAFVVW